MAVLDRGERTDGVHHEQGRVLGAVDRSSDLEMRMVTPVEVLL